MATERLSMRHTREILRQRIPEEERGGVVLHGSRGEEQRAPAVERQLQPGEKARVVDEEPVRLLADVAELVADAECGAFEDRLLRH